MAVLELRDYAMVAALLHQRIKPLKPLQNPDHIEAFNEYRELAAKLAVLFEDDDHIGGGRDFDARNFISYVMTGGPQ